MDIKSFFVTIHRPTLLGILRSSLPTDPADALFSSLVQLVFAHDARTNFRWVGAEHARHLVPPHKSWLSQPPDHGIPIGNLTSQFGATVLLTEWDHFIARRLRPGAYARYMDDLLLLDTDPAKLECLVAPIGDWLTKHRRQNVNPAKTHLTRLSDGIGFLGYTLRQVPSPARPLLIQWPPEKQWKLVKACRHLERVGLPPDGILDPLFMIRSRRAPQQALAEINSRLGNAQHAATHDFRTATLNKLIESPALAGRIEAGNGHRAVRLKDPS
jgi:hypothetical protein